MNEETTVLNRLVRGELDAVLIAVGREDRARAILARLSNTEASLTIVAVRPMPSVGGCAAARRHDEDVTRAVIENFLAHERGAALPSVHQASDAMQGEHSMNCRLATSLEHTRPS